MEVPHVSKLHFASFKLVEGFFLPISLPFCRPHKFIHHDTLVFLSSELSLDALAPYLW